jgi:hypothetical protein
MADFANQLASPTSVTVEANRLRALQLRESGAKYRDIARALNCSVGRAHQLVQEGLAELHDEVTDTASNVRTLELNRLDQMWFDLRSRDPKQLSEPRFIEAQLKIMERRARLLGLDAPVAIGGPDGGPIPLALDARAAFIAKIDEMEHRMMLGAGAATPVPASGETVASVTPESSESHA